MNTSSAHINLENGLRKEMRLQVERRHYKNISEYVSDIARRDIEQERARQQFNAEMMKGVLSPDSDQPYEKHFSELGQKVKKAGASR